MNYFFLDASATVKRYIPEIGTPEMNHLFARVPLYRMICLFEGVGEVIFVFVRRRNEGRITAERFSQIKQRFETEIIHSPEVVKMLPLRNQIDKSWEFIEKHSINSTDAILLQCVLDVVSELRTSGDDLVLVSSDKRLLRASRSEGLVTFDPEVDSQTTLDFLVNSS